MEWVFEFRMVRADDTVIATLLLLPCCDHRCCFVNILFVWLFFVCFMFHLFWWGFVLLFLDGKGCRWLLALLFCKFLNLCTVKHCALRATSVGAVAFLTITIRTSLIIFVGRDWTRFRCWFNICYLCLRLVDCSFKLTGTVVNWLTWFTTVFRYYSSTVCLAPFELAIQSNGWASVEIHRIVHI